MSECKGVRELSALKELKGLRSIEIRSCSGLLDGLTNILKEWHPGAEIMGGER